MRSNVACPHADTPVHCRVDCTRSREVRHIQQQQINSGSSSSGSNSISNNMQQYGQYAGCWCSPKIKLGPRQVVGWEETHGSVELTVRDTPGTWLVKGRLNFTASGGLGMKRGWWKAGSTSRQMLG